MRATDRIRRARAGGFSLLELMIAVSFLAACILGVGYAMQVGIRTTREMRERQIVQSWAQVYMDRLVSLNFGSMTDPAPTKSQLDTLFAQAGGIVAVTLASLTKSPSGEGWTFRLEDFPVEGRWAVLVTRDLDGDGSISGDMEENARAVRIAISFDGWPVLSTIRGRETHA